MDWGDFLNQQSQDLIGNALNRPAPAAPMGVTPYGQPYREGAPVAGSGKLPVVMGMSPVVYLGLAAVLVLGGGYFLLKK